MEEGKSWEQLGSLDKQVNDATFPCFNREKSLGYNEFRGK